VATKEVKTLLQDFSVTQSQSKNNEQIHIWL